MFGVALPESRWISRWGPGVGPAVLYWGELVVFIGIAWLLGRWSRSPLRFSEWLLLGLGLSTQSWWVFWLTAAWLIAMRWREDWMPDEEFSRLRFNAVQVVLAGFTFVTIITLVFSAFATACWRIRTWKSPAATDSVGGYKWFQDQTAGVLGEPQHFLRADVGLPHAVLRLGELDGVRAGALAALGVQRVEGRRPVARRRGGSPLS